MAVRFSGSQDTVINYGDVSFLDGVTKVSFHCKVWVDGGFTTQSVVRKNGTYTPMQKSSSTPTRFIGAAWNSSCSLDISSNDDVTGTGQWVTITQKYDASASSDIYISVDGEALKTWGLLATTSICSSGTDPLVIGGTESDTELFDGAICEVAFWTGYTFTQTEADALHLGISPLMIAPDDLKFYAPLHDTGNLRDMVGGINPTGPSSGFTDEPHPQIYMPSSQIWVPPVVAAVVTTARYRGFLVNVGRLMR